MIVIEIDYRSVPLKVEGKHYKGFPGTRETPPERDEFEIHDIVVDETSIIDLLSEEQLQELEQEILNDNF